MIKIGLYTSLVFCLASALFSSCTEPFDIKTDDAPSKIVIYGGLTNEITGHSIMISSTLPYFDGKSNPGVSGARVQIKSSNGIYDFVENDTVSGLYQTAKNAAGIPGIEYTLIVEVDFNRDGVTETYTAASLMPTPVYIDSITTRSLNIMGRKMHPVYLYAQEPPAEDYYLCSYKVNDDPVTSAISRISLLNDKMFNGQYLSAMPLRMFGDVSDKDVDREEEGRVYLNVGDKVTLSLGHIEKGYYNFILQCQNEMGGGSSFFGAPASNIITNISNGGIGYFSCYPVMEADVIVSGD
ncbi:MAG: hypothetical protein EZS26_000139 [Candidatus Ordinivivax streblomastigis]|uniref:DUF4249 domain-containing protein n=1 Tax=Candidatus Ordinivivax streblomastigis TaxID=2540710 RepID=A0A5M8P5C8_9BACT|nr:MAG: hypothetical protein EZS26_000139 [Candidatus Ordinivivax streblomastigis]